MLTHHAHDADHHHAMRQATIALSSGKAHSAVVFCSCQKCRLAALQAEVEEMGTEVRESACLQQEVEQLKQQLLGQAGLIREGEEASRCAQVCLTWSA